MIGEFLATSLLIELTPGPNMGWLALLAAARGRRLGLAAVAGIALGLSLAAVAAAFGLSLLIAATPWMFHALRMAGAAYLLYLAWEAWSGAADDDAQGLEASASHYFMQGLVSNALNPKAYLVYAAVLPQFLGASAGLTEVATLSALYVGVATAVHSAVALLAGSASSFFKNKQRARLFSRISAVLLVGIAIWFFWSTSGSF